MNLIVNADDFGLTMGINSGILEAMTNGIVTSCTMVANGRADAFLHAVRLCHEHQLDVGVHLVLTMGWPILDHANTLTDESGHFYSLADLEEHVYQMEPRELKAEFMAQIARIRQAGIVITHLDSHHHVHMHPHIRDVYLEIAGELGLPVRTFLEREDGAGQEVTNRLRVHQPEQIITGFYGDGVSEEGLLSILRTLSGESAEIMCHPAYMDQDLLEASRYNKERERELKILTSPVVKTEVEKLGINLIGYRGFGRG